MSCLHSLGVVHTYLSLTGTITRDPHQPREHDRLPAPPLHDSPRRGCSTLLAKEKCVGKNNTTILRRVLPDILLSDSGFVLGEVMKYFRV